MTKVNQAESTRSGIITGAVITSAFLKEAEIWINAQSEVLSAMETLMGDWMKRRQEAFDTWSGSLKSCVSVKTPSISFKLSKIGCATPFGWLLPTQARWLAIPRF